MYDISCTLLSNFGDGGLAHGGSWEGGGWGDCLGEGDLRCSAGGARCRGEGREGGDGVGFLGGTLRCGVGRGEGNSGDIIWKWAKG